MFVGEFRHSLDEKGRIVFPVRMRDDLGAQVVLQKGLERCIYVFAPEQWEREVEKVSSLPQTDPKARQYARFVFSSASAERVDRQGRLTVPQAFREYAALDRDAFVVGAGQRVEIWEAERWEAQRSETEANLPEITTELGI